MRFAPEAFRSTRVEVTEKVKAALIATNDLGSLVPSTLRANPSAISTLRMCTAPPLAVDRLIGLSGASKSLMGSMEDGKLAKRMKSELLDENLSRVCTVLSKLLDHDIFPWLDAKKTPTELERDRASTVVADRLCSAVANPIVRNAQEQRQLALIAKWLEKRGYRKQPHLRDLPLNKMTEGTYAFRMNLLVGKTAQINIPIDVVIQPKKPKKNRLPVLIEAKSAGDFTNTNKRRKEEVTKVHQLQAKYGTDINFILFLCGYFGSDYLG